MNSAPGSPAKRVKPRLVAVRFTKAQFMALSLRERELLIRLGLAQNDVLMIQRMWGAIYYRNPKTVWATEAHAVQQVALLLILVGKLFEALEVFRLYFNSQPFSRTYLAKFDDRQKSAVSVLKRALGSGEILAAIRNDFAFHYHKTGHLSRFMRSWPDDRLLTLYLGDPDANTLSAYASEPFLRALMRRTRRRTPTAALRYIQNSAAQVIGAFNTFISAIQVLAIREMLKGQIQPEEIAVNDDEFQPHDQFGIPFFAGLPSRPPRSVRRELKQLREAQRVT